MPRLEMLTAGRAQRSPLGGVAPSLDVADGFLHPL